MNRGRLAYHVVARLALACGPALALIVLGGAARGQAGIDNDRAGPAFFAFQEPLAPPRPVQIMVHRGLAAQAPENSRQAITACIADQFEWVEIDLRLSSDGVHVVAHDERLEGKTNGHGAIGDFTTEQLLRLDAGSWFARRFAATRLLTLAQTLELARGHINLYLDCKRVNPEKLAGEVLAAGMQRQVVVYGDVETVTAVRSASHGAVAVMTKWHPTQNPEPWLDRHRLASVEIDANEVTAEVCQTFHRKGVKVEAKTLGQAWDRPEVWQRMMAAGVDWIQTDDPHEVQLAALRFRNVPRAVKISLHRGAKELAPENTMPAISRALELGADYIEMDIRTSKDGAFFLLHDARLDRTTSGKGPIREQTAAELRRLEAGAWFGLPFRGIAIPTFEQCLDRLHRGQAHLYADAKDIAPESLLALLEKYQMIDRCVVFQSPSYLKRLKALNSRVRLLPHLHDPAQLDQLAAELQPYGVDASWEILSRELVERCHAQGIHVFSDAIGQHETLEDYARAISWGVDVIQTDNPALVYRAIELAGERSSGNR